MFSLPDCLRAGTVFSCLQTLIWAGTTPLVLMGLQLTDCRSWDLSVSITTWSNSIWSLNLSVSVSLSPPCIYWFCFPGKPRTLQCINSDNVNKGILLSTKKKWTIKPWKAWRKLKCIFLSERNQSEKPTYSPRQTIRRHTCMRPAQQWLRWPTNRILKINKSLLQAPTFGVVCHTAAGNWNRWSVKNRSWSQSILASLRRHVQKHMTSALGLVQPPFSVLVGIVNSALPGEISKSSWVRQQSIQAHMVFWHWGLLWSCWAAGLPVLIALFLQDGGTCIIILAK